MTGAGQERIDEKKKLKKKFVQCRQRFRIGRLKYMRGNIYWKKNIEVIKHAIIEYMKFGWLRIK